MASRWGAGEDTLTACNMDFFPFKTLDDTTELTSEESLDALQSCLDSTSILSIFDDNLLMEGKSLDDESEATLLTALTEILDNVDDENLSPFDTLPDSDLLSGQKGREVSPLRRLLCLSRSPPEKDSPYSSRPLPAKSITRKRNSLQRSDGEEEDDGSLTLSPLRQDSPATDHLEWDELTLPLSINLEQESLEGLSLNLGDIVRHMHPYCMTICLDEDVGEQMLPAGGILLEVVDQGENGEPIVAIPDLNMHIAAAVEDSTEQKVYEEEDSSEHIVVDDDDDEEEVKMQINYKATRDEVKEKMKVKEKKSSNRKKKRKSKKERKTSVVEKRVLRSSKPAPKESPDKLERSPVVITSLTLERSISGTSVPCDPEGLQPSAPAQMEHPQEVPDPGMMESRATTEPMTLVAEPLVAEPLVAEPVVPEPPVPEPKPKSLSLAEYRRLRQQKKPVPVEKQEDHSTKWPKLPELPRELPPIPCLPDPSPKGRCQNLLGAKKDQDEVKPAWQPRGPCAPPTPEALLAPPAYMMVNKVSTTSAAKPPPKVDTSTGSTVPHPSDAVPSPVSTRQTTSIISPPKESVLVKAVKVVTCSDGQRVVSVENNQTKMVSVKPATPEIVLKLTAAKTSEIKVAAQSRKTAPAPLVVFPTKASQPSVPALKKAKPITVPGQNRRDQTQELIQSFTTEMGIEATDLTSLLEQFEETQAKEEKCVPEVSGRAAAVGNSREVVVARTASTAVERVKASDVANTAAALTPPATPPPQMWKPLAPAALLGKERTSETLKLKVIQIEARPLPGIRSKFITVPAPAPTVSAAIACLDHDYCLPDGDIHQADAGKRWNIKKHASITIKPIKEVSEEDSQKSSVQCSKPQTKDPRGSRTEGLGHSPDAPERSLLLETPDVSPVRQESLEASHQRQGPSGRSYRDHEASRSPGPRGRSVDCSRKRSQRSPSPLSSDSGSSRSRSRSPERKRYRSCSSRSSSRSLSQSSSRSSSRSCSPPRRRRYSYSSSRSGSWSRSRSRSRSPQRRAQWSRGRSSRSPSYRSSYSCPVKPNPEEVKQRKEKAIEERRVVYVGGISGTMTQRELKDRFSYFGEVEECTLHFRDQGDNYGFVTYYKTTDAFNAIESGNKLRKANELPFDLCFGGRRQFCKSTYADLDSCREYDPLPGKASHHDALDFDTLLKRAQQNLKR